ncbi:hypothetical protein GCM10010508_10200 [Streptomyces naganishii JCM 4654]|uniref:DUF4232 domain-containing protein n=1 Tax=Streptomyces naganishii JCM 4654 TaxID=1306179 RepID=A0A919CV43_9ACTN|nr:hypothetical protein GCM10010508_10200 [Streptomyces naganishii JCM 4654]
MSENGEGRESHERHEPYAWHEPTRPQEQEHSQSHAGNDTVNHSPDDLGPGGLDPDELDLRRMLHQAVGDVEPREGTLDHLRRAVPARRARKRQAAVGMAAAALFLGTAVPALVHVSDSTGSDANPAMAGQAAQSQGGTGQGKNPDGGPSGGGDPSGKAPDRATSGKRGDQKGGKGAGTGNGTGGGTGTPSTTTGTGTPACTAAQLGSPTATVAAPDSAGIVYGTFHVANISSASCTVSGSGSVSTLAQGAADATKISVVRHSAGDAATSLPDPSTEASGLILLPGAAYEVKFAWVPSAACPSTTGGGTDTGGTQSGAPSPDPSPSQDAGATNSTTGTETGASTQMVREDGAPADGSVVVSHTAEAGSPTVSATVPNACSGTVYRTGVLAAS